MLQLNRYWDTTIHSFVFLHAPKGLLPGHLQEEDGTKVDGNEDGTKDRDPPKKICLLQSNADATLERKSESKACSQDVSLSRGLISFHFLMNLMVQFRWVEPGQALQRLVTFATSEAAYVCRVFLGLPAASKNSPLTCDLASQCPHLLLHLLGHRWR